MNKDNLKRKDYNALFKGGKLEAGELVFLKFKKNDLKINRFCFVVGLKVSKKSTIRNKLKRRLKDIIKKISQDIKTGIDIAIIARPKIIDKNYKEINDNLKDLLKRSKIYK